MFLVGVGGTTVYTLRSKKWSITYSKINREGIKIKKCYCTS